VGQPLNPDAVIIAKILWQYDLPIYTVKGVKKGKGRKSVQREMGSLRFDM